MSNLLTDDELHEIDELVYLNDNEGDTDTMAELNYKVPPLLAHIAALKSDLELLIKIAAREQRYKCADCIENRFAAQSVIMKAQADAQKAPCPDIADVLQKWQKAKETNNG